MEELHRFDGVASRIDEKLSKTSADAEWQKLSASLAGIRARIVALLSQAEQGKLALLEAQGIQNKRKLEVTAYRQFLDDTDAWLRRLILTINERHSSSSYKVRYVNFNFYFFYFNP